MSIDWKTLGGLYHTRGSRTKSWSDRIYGPHYGLKYDGHIGDPMRITGDCTNIVGLVHPNLFGVVTGISGDVTNLDGCVSGYQFAVPKLHDYQDVLYGHSNRLVGYIQRNIKVAPSHGADMAIFDLQTSDWEHCTPYTMKPHLAYWVSNFLKVHRV